MKHYMRIALRYALLGLFGVLSFAQQQVAATNTGTPVYALTSDVITSSITIASTSFTNSTLTLPTTPTNTTVHGKCHLVYQQATAVATVSFGFGLSNAPTELYVTSSIGTSATSATTAYTAITTVGPTIVGAAATPGAAATNYAADFDFVLVTGSTNPAALTLYGLTSNAADALVLEPGSSCSYQW
jgi:hypothetical protein